MVRSACYLPVFRSIGLAAALLLPTSLLAAPGAAPSPSIGAMIWSFRTHGPVRTSPVLLGNLVVAASTDGFVYGIDAESGQMRWRYSAGAPIVSTPVAQSNRVYVVDRANRVHAIGADNGQAIWQRETGIDLPLPWGYEGWDYVTGSPALAQGTLFVGSGNGFLYALDPDDGSLRWQFQAEGRIRATPTVHEGTVYVGDATGVFRALDADTGAVNWEFITEGHETDAEDFGFDRRQIYSAALVDRDLVFFGSRDAKIYALDRDSGSLRWKADDGTSAWVIAAPAMHRGQLLVTRSSSARVRALDPATGSEIWSQTTSGLIFAPATPWGDSTVVANGAGAVLAYDDAGKEQWRYALGSGIWSAPALTSDALYLAVDDGTVRRYGITSEAPPLLRVFADRDVAQKSALGGSPSHTAIRDYFVTRGYGELDLESLEQFLRARIADGRRSAIVFAVSGWLEAYEGGAESLLRRYLDAGGRAIWMGHAPGFLVRDEEGSVVGIDRERPAELLGVDHSAYDTDYYGVWPTAEGQRMGLKSWWISGTRASDVEKVTVLARNEVGGAVAWMREYANGGRYMNLFFTLDSRRLDEIRAVAEHGFFRSPSTRHVEAPPAR